VLSPCGWHSCCQSLAVPGDSRPAVSEAAAGQPDWSIQASCTVDDVQTLQPQPCVGLDHLWQMYRDQSQTTQWLWPHTMSHYYYYGMKTAPKGRKSTCLWVSQCNFSCEIFFSFSFVFHCFFSVSVSFQFLQIFQFQFLVFFSLSFCFHFS